MDRHGKSETDSIEFRLFVLEETRENLRQGTVFRARVGRRAQDLIAVVLVAEDCEPGVGGADISRQDPVWAKTHRMSLVIQSNAPLGSNFSVGARPKVAKNLPRWSQKKTALSRMSDNAVIGA